MSKLSFKNKKKENKKKKIAAGECPGLPVQSNMLDRAGGVPGEAPGAGLYSGRRTGDLIHQASRPADSRKLLPAPGVP